MKITFTPYDATKQITFEDVEAYTYTEFDDWVDLTTFDGDTVRYNLKNVEFYRISR